MGRKRSTVKKVQINISIPEDLRTELKEAGANFTQLFLIAAEKFLQDKKENQS